MEYEVKIRPSIWEPYNPFESIRIMNPKQASFYCSNGVRLRDIKLSNDKETGDPVFVYYFTKSETKDVFDLWCKRKNNV